MRRNLYLSLLVAVGLFAIAGIAAATQPRPATQDVSASFSANQVRSHSRTCTQGGEHVPHHERRLARNLDQHRASARRQPRHRHSHGRERDHR